MSSFNRRFVLFFGAALAGCGFTPAYGPSGAATRLLNTILVDEPDTRPAYLLTREIEEKLGRGSPGRYGLSYSIVLDEEPIAISSDNITTRFNLLGSVSYTLRDLSDGTVLVSGRADSFTGYSASGTTVSAQAAERDAEARLMVILADQIIRRLTVEASDLPA